MEACQQHPLLGWPAAHVHPVGTRGSPREGPANTEPPLNLASMVSVLSLQERGDHSFLLQPGDSGSLSVMVRVTSHNKAEYSHRVEEVGTPLTALEGLKGGKGKRESALLMESCQAAPVAPILVLNVA
jgi:hypothetical protein